MTIEIADVILLLAAAQGLFLTALIFHKHRILYANRLLGGLILFYSILLLHLLLGELGYFKFYPQMTLALIGVGFLLPPLHYLYAKFMVHEARRFRKKDWLHFAPFVAYEVFRLPQYFQPQEELFAILRTAAGETLTFDSIFFNWTLLLLGFAYMYRTILILHRYSRNIKNEFSSIDKIKLDWLRNITYMMTAVLGIFLLENILLISGFSLSHNFNLSSILTAVYVYALGYLGLFKSEVFAAPGIAASISRLAELERQRQMENREAHPKPKKYEKSGLSAEKSEQYLHQLLELMDEREPYTESDLTLSKLSDLLSLSAHNLSEVINTQRGQNFFDFVNRYRVEKVKRDLLDPEKKHLNLLAIAFEAGFSSKSSFNTIFKKHTRTTPSEYRRQAAAAS